MSILERQLLYNICFETSLLSRDLKMELEKLLTKRGKEKQIHDGHTYVFDRFSACKEVKFWRCSFKSDGCKARLYTCVKNGQVMSTRNIHNHGSDAGRIESEKVKNAVKRRSLETVETPAQVISAALASTTSAVQGQVPNKGALRKIIHRARNSAHAVPSSPVDLKSLVIPEAYTRYPISEDETIKFLLYDTGNDANRILLFGREDAREWSQFMKRAYVDGTFVLAPPLFSQVFPILIEREGFVFPVLIALLTDKKQSTYCKLFRLIKSIWPNFKPDSFSTDYEMAILNAIAEEFPEAEIRGCLFHLSQNVKKKLGREHLLSRYNNDADFALKARMIVSLAFVPIEKLEGVVTELLKYLPESLQPVLEWFEDNYIGHLNRNGSRKRPLFTPSIWSVYERVVNGQNRTNNFAEAAHRALQTELDVQHPSIWKFIDGLRAVQKTRDLHYALFLKGDKPPYKRLKYQEADARIAESVRNFSRKTSIEYLTGIAQNFFIN